MGLEETVIAFTIHNHGRIMEYHLLDIDMGPFRAKFYGNLDLYQVPQQEMTEEEFDLYKHAQTPDGKIRVTHRKTQEELKAIRDIYKDTLNLDSLENIPRSNRVLNSYATL